MSSPTFPSAGDARPLSAADRSPPSHLHEDAPLPPRKWTSQALLAGAREVPIDHAGSIYRLRVTQLGKLILTK
jgi:hemin uptake protein HemP